MIFYRRRKPLTTDRIPGQFPSTKILWRNTAIAWAAFAWGMTFLFSLNAAGVDVYINPGSTFSWLAYGYLFSETLLFAVIGICIVCGAFFGSVLLLTSTIVTLHRSWRIDDAVMNSDSEPSHHS